MKVVAQRLTEFFGATWLSQAFSAQGAEALEPVLHSASPVLTLRPPAYAFGRYLMWWAAIEMTSRGPSQALVRRDICADVTRSRFVHGMTQLRLAACSSVAGFDASLEDDRPGWAADVVVQDGQASVSVEVVSLKADHASADLSHAGSLHLDFAVGSARADGLGIRGEVPGVLQEPQERMWRVAMDVAAQQCAERKEAVDVDFAGLHLTFTPDPEELTLTGPLIARDVTRRLVKKLRNKARQARRGYSPWIWMEDDGALGLVFEYRSADLRGKWEKAAVGFADVLQDHTHLGGIALATFELDDLRQYQDERMTLKGGAAVRCAPAPRSVRSTVLVSPASEAATELFTTLAMAEGQLVDTALASAGIGSDLNGLFVDAP